MANHVLTTKFIYIWLQVVVLHFINIRGEVHKSSKAINAGNLEQHYPNLYFSAKDLPKLRAQASSSHAEIYKELTKLIRDLGSRVIPPESVIVFNSKWNERYGNLLGSLAVYCALTPGDREALDLAKLFMKRFTSYNTWLVTGLEKDEVPLAHSILGYATAFDCLYSSFTLDERDRYAIKLLQTGTQLFNAANKVWWGRSYIHNHVATNYMALLTAALVLKPYYPKRVLAWQEKSINALNATMEFLKLVVDGSFQEGVSYGTYTMRSLTQFMFISERHFARNYRTNNWLRKHFDFLLYTIIPGFQLTVGFADSNPNWAYGPESQLEFLESYLHTDGRAKWLSNEIKSHRVNKVNYINRRDYKSQVHTEFLFLNSSLKPKRASEVKLHVFSDWGVLTYGGGIPDPHVFLSFKCSHLHGRAINLLRPSLNFNTQRGFVPGHEQPDQGSFVFVTKDQAVITEPRYAPKYTYLQNTLMFGPSNKGCTRPYLGQLGECKMWFNHKFDSRTWGARGELVGYSRENDVIFMSGDMTQVYDKDLGLTTVYRALVMLAPNVLVVVDIVRFRADSVTSHASAFFHNSDFVFNVDAYDNDKSRCAAIGRYKMCWEHLNAKTVNISTKNNFKVTKQRHATNFVNITWKRSELLTSTAYVFHGPQYTLKHLKLSKIEDNGININLNLNSVEYSITLSARYDDPRLRRKLLGSNGYGKVNIKSENIVSTLHLGVKMRGDANDVSKASDVSTMTSQIPISRVHRYPFGFVYIVVCTMLLFLYLNFKTRLRFRLKVIAFCALSICLAIYVYIGSSYKHFETSRLSPYSTAPILPTRKNDRLLNAVVITGLPSSGMELALELFTTNPDFITIGVPSESRVGDAEDNLDLREWTKRDILDEKRAEWWNTLLKTPTTRGNTEDYIALVNPLNLLSNHGAFIRKSRGAFAAISFRNPGWLFRMSVLFENNQTPLLYVVRDPRSWIEHMLGRPDETNLFLKEFKTAMQTPLGTFPLEIQHLRELNFATLKTHIALAHIWTAFATYAFRLRSTLPPGGLKIVHFENLIKSPRATADGVYSFLEMPFPAAVEHRIMQVTKTGLYKFKNYNTIEPSLCNWGKVLTKLQVSEIYGICKKAMKNISYR
jgi:hypothetical protein